MERLVVSFENFWISCAKCNTPAPKGKTLDEATRNAKDAGFITSNGVCFCSKRCIDASMYKNADIHHSPARKI